MMNLLDMRISAADFIRAVGAGIAAVLTYVFGGADSWLIGLIVVVALDYISGVIAAIINGELSSRRGFIGILKKLLIFCAVGVANIVDVSTGAGGVLRSLSIGFLMANEGISVLENCARCGVPMPEKLIAALEQLRGKEETITDIHKGGGTDGTKRGTDG